MLHVKKENWSRGSKLFASAGATLAKKNLNDPSLPAVLPHSWTHVSPLLGLTSVLLRNKSPLVVETVTERDNAYMIKFQPYSYPLEIEEIVSARKVVVVTDDGEKELHANDTISKPR